MSQLPIYRQIQNDVTAGIGFAQNRMTKIHNAVQKLYSAINQLLEVPAGYMLFGFIDDDEGFVSYPINQWACRVNEPLKFVIRVDWSSSNDHKGPFSFVPMSIETDKSGNIVLCIDRAGGFFALATSPSPASIEQFDFTGMAKQIIDDLRQIVAQEFPQS